MGVWFQLELTLHINFWRSFAVLAATFVHSLYILGRGVPSCPCYGFSWPLRIFRYVHHSWNIS